LLPEISRFSEKLGLCVRTTTAQPVINTVINGSGIALKPMQTSFTWCIACVWGILFCGSRLECCIVHSPDSSSVCLTLASKTEDHGWSDVTESMATIRPPCCEFRGEYSCYLNISITSSQFNLLEALARPSISSSLRITDRSFRYASPRLWNQLPASLRQSVLFSSRPRSEGWPHHGRTCSIYPCPVSFWLTLPRRVMSTSWCCTSKPCVAFLAYVHLALFLALSLFLGNSLVYSWCDHSMLASLLWRCLTVPSLLQLC